MKIKETTLWQFLKILPKKKLSRLVFELTHTPFPKELLHSLIRLYSWYFQVNLEEAIIPRGGFSTFSQFFSRHLKEGARRIDPRKEIWVSPCDGKIYSFGTLKEGMKIEQIKGWDYTLEELLGGREWNSTFQKGFYITLYLSPKDYHRFHAPMSGTLEKVRHISGEFWPVNPLALSRLPQLFCRNERVILEVFSPFGPYLMVFVAALNVGSIHLHPIPKLKTNRRTRKIDILLPSLLVSKGEELGYFEMGSTIILILPSGFQRSSLLEKGKSIQMGMPLGKVEK
ncbi:MAG: phosphatidylserine decarboxylase [Planctomycetota bacterium]|nr:MAG: phosphatidylserine decarboxylase [Planctomycetota bacterium]